MRALESNIKEAEESFKPDDPLPKSDQVTKFNSSFPKSLKNFQSHFKIYKTFKKLIKNVLFSQKGLGPVQAIKPLGYWSRWELPTTSLLGRAAALP